MAKFKEKQSVIVITIYSSRLFEYTLYRIEKVFYTTFIVNFQLVEILTKLIIILTSAFWKSRQTTNNQTENESPIHHDEFNLKVCWNISNEWKYLLYWRTCKFSTIVVLERSLIDEIFLRIVFFTSREHQITCKKSHTYTIYADKFFIVLKFTMAQIQLIYNCKL